MKLCISCTGRKIDGYLSINLNPIVGFTNIDATIPQASAEEIIAEDVLEFFPLTKIEEVINYLISKLRHGGQLVLSCKDIYVLNHLITRRDFDMVNINLALYGNGLGIKSVMAMDDLVAFLSSRKLKVLQKRWDGIRAIVTAERI